MAVFLRDGTDTKRQQENDKIREGNIEGALGVSINTYQFHDQFKRCRC